ncbi:MAG TPA: glycosyltransferase family 4 protein [Solirubrobacteraceae bacterium]|jgi:glycosyltransferase involved in cell wall biosynthesis
MRALIVDPSAYSPPYDEALCAALAQRGAEVELVTSRFAHGARPAPDGYSRRELFYRRSGGAAGSRRRLAKLATHVGDMRALGRRPADVVHHQWIPLPWLDVALLPSRPRVLTLHNTAPRSGRFGRARALREVIARMDALVVHSDHGAASLRAQGVEAERVHVIPHGAFAPGPAGELPPELADDGRPVVLMFGLLRPYKGLGTLLEAWPGIGSRPAAQLWIVGRPMMQIPPLPAGASLVGRYVSDGEANALLRRADVLVLPYERDERIDGSGVLAAALGAGRPTVVSAVGALAEVAAGGAVLGVEPGDPVALHAALAGLVADPAARDRLGAAARDAAAGPYSWDVAAERTLALYAALTG